MLRSPQAWTTPLAGATVLSVLCVAWPAVAAEITAARFPGDPYALILIEGPIEDGDDQRFADAAAPYLEAPAMVVLRSPGGSVRAALDIGAQIQRASFATNVLEGEECRAACAFIWLAGIQRHLSEASIIGVPATDSRRDEQDLTSGSWTASLEGYLAALGLPERAIRYVTGTGAGDERPITPEIARALGIPVWEYRDGGIVSPLEEPAEMGWRRWDAPMLSPS